MIAVLPASFIESPSRCYRICGPCLPLGSGTPYLHSSVELLHQHERSTDFADLPRLRAGRCLNPSLLKLQLTCPQTRRRRDLDVLRTDSNRCCIVATGFATSEEVHFGSTDEARHEKIIWCTVEFRGYPPVQYYLDPAPRSYQPSSSLQPDRG